MTTTRKPCFDPERLENDSSIPGYAEHCLKLVVNDRHALVTEMVQSALTHIRKNADRV